MLQVKRDKYMILNGELTLWQPATEPFVYQDIHTLGHQCRYTQQHIDFLNIAGSNLFGKKLNTSTDAIELQIRELLKANRAIRNYTIGVRLSLDSDGNYRLEDYEATIYSGYVLRLLRPTALCIASDVPWPAFPTSALLQTKQLADVIARQRDIHEAILTDSQGHIISYTTKPLILIKEYTATFSPTTQHSVESRLALEACQHINLNCKFDHFTIEDAMQADELLYVNYQGITAFSKIGRHAYMDIIAANIANAMEELFQMSNKNITI
jgi:branched-subunit amino acid aminotransferase/4-amino-4-deoxychorismate lyase